MRSQQAGSVLAIIVFSQFAGTSLWFAGNAIIGDLQTTTSGGFAGITSIVQLGFIAGTLIFSLLTIADRFPAPLVFFFSSLFAAAANLVLVVTANNEVWLYSMRFITGFFLAGIYPVGMKIAADLFPGKLGNALGLLVGALVLGTAFPHLLKSELHNFYWKHVLVFTSLLAFTGGILILAFIPRKLHVRPQNGLDLHAAFKVFQSYNFRSAAFGYFGHMWELYAVWAFTPAMILLFNKMHGDKLNVPFWSFLVIGAGSIGCVVGGWISKKSGSKKVAFYSLLISGVCCLISPFIFFLPSFFFLLIMMIWGMTVVSDSPQFSTLVARSAPAAKKGTALTIVTSVGFAITIVSIQLLKPLFDRFDQYGFLLLLIGPVLGLLSLKNYKQADEIITAQKPVL